MGVRRAHEGGIGLVRQPRVIHEAAIAAQQGVVFDAGLMLSAGRADHGGSEKFGLWGLIYSR
jgi:hypothetical protein